MDEKYMREALIEAQKAYDEDEVPIGCVIVRDGEIIARTHNTKISSNNSLCHAETVALDKAQKCLGTKYLYDCSMYVTLEPCAMCAGAILNTRLGNLIFGAREPKTGCCVSVYPIIEEKRFNHKTQMKGGILANECKEIMQKFFEEKRKNKC